VADEQNSIDNSKTIAGFNDVIKRFRHVLKFDSKDKVTWNITLRPDENMTFSTRENYAAIAGTNYGVVVSDSNHNGRLDTNDKIVVAKGEDVFVSSVKDFIRLCKEASGADVNKDGKIDSKDVDTILQDPQKISAMMEALGGDFKLLQNIKEASLLITDIRKEGKNVGQLASQLVTRAQQSAPQKSTER
jgi:hypothetical protein